MKSCAPFPAVVGAAALVLGGACLMAAALPHPAAAQTGSQSRLAPVVTIPENTAITIHAKIKSIDPAKRQVTLVGRGGNTVTLTAGPDVRLETLKAGDTVDAQYYQSVAFAVAQPGESVGEDEMQQLVARPAQGPGGIAIQTTRINGLVVGIDLQAHTVEVVNPQGGEVVTVVVNDPARQAKLPQLKVGDTITAVISQALAVSIQPAPKSWF